MPLLGRETGETTSPELVLDDQVVINESPIAVQAWLVPSLESADRFHIHLRVVPFTPLEINLRACLSWGPQEYVTTLAAGQTEYEDISPPEFTLGNLGEPSRTFRLTLEPLDNDALE